MRVACPGNLVALKLPLLQSKLRNLVLQTKPSAKGMMNNMTEKDQTAVLILIPYRHYLHDASNCIEVYSDGKSAGY